MGIQKWGQEGWQGCGIGEQVREIVWPRLQDTHTLQPGSGPLENSLWLSTVQVLCLLSHPLLYRNQ